MGHKLFVIGCTFLLTSIFAFSQTENILNQYELYNNRGEVYFRLNRFEESLSIRLHLLDAKLSEEMREHQLKKIGELSRRMK